jgi:hypothetical protein
MHKWTKLIWAKISEFWCKRKAPYAKQKCEYCDKARIDRNCRQTPTVFLATDFHIAHDPNMHDVLVYYFGTSGSAAHAYGTFKLVNILSFLNFLTSLSSVRSGISNLCSGVELNQHRMSNVFNQRQNIHLRTTHIQGQSGGTAETSWVYSHGKIM